MAITNSALPFILEKASTIWPGSMTEADFIPQFGAVKAVAAQQTARVSYANLPDQADAKITWINNCDITVDTCADDCDFTGVAADTSVQTLEITQCKQSTFSEPIDAWRGNLFGLADALAVDINKTMKAQLETVAQYVVSILNSSAGTNEYDNQGEFTIAGTDTTIPAAAWTDTGIFGKLRRTAIKNRFDMPYLLTGDSLDQMVYMARTSSQNGEGKGDNVRIGEFPLYTDLFNIEAVNTTEYVTYLINKGAIAFASKAYHPTTPEVLGGTMTRFSISNRFFPMLKHDVEFVEKCTAGVWAIHYRIKARYDVFLNPTGCTSTRKGVLKLIRETGV